MDKHSAHLPRRIVWAIGFALVLLASIIAWPYLIAILPLMPQPLPIYPNAQSWQSTLSAQQDHVCMGSTEAEQQLLRVTHFLTADPPNLVGRYYHTQLVEQGSYENARTSYSRDTYLTFTQTTRQGTSLLEPTQGVGVALQVKRQADNTVVTIYEYRYTELSRACHL